MHALIGLMARQGIAALVGVVMALGMMALFTSATDDLLWSVPAGARWGLFCSAIMVLLFEVPRIRQHLRHRVHLLGGAAGVPRGVEQRWQGCMPVTLTVAGTTAALVVRWMWTGAQAGVLLAIPVYASLLHAVGWLLAASARAVRLWFATRALPAARQTPSAFPLFAAAEVSFVALLMFVRLPHVALLKGGLYGALVGLQLSLDKEHQFAEFLVQLGPDDTLAEVSYLQDYGVVTRATPAATRAESMDASQTYIVRAPTVIAGLLALEAARDPENVVHIELNQAIRAEGPPEGAPCPSGSGPTRDPLSGRQVVLRDSGAAAVLQSGRQWSPRVVRLAVIDTGIDSTHEDLRQIIDGPAGSDPHGHGTAMAGIAAAVGNNGVGIASLNDEGRFVRVRDYPAVVPGVGGNLDDIADAVFMAVDNRAEVILMAFGAKGEAPKLVHDAIQYALEEGVIVVAAAGNDGPVGRASEQWPANVPGVVVVTALVGKSLAHFSNQGGRGSVGAPGEGICAPVAGGGYRETDGTSAAAAFVAGALARHKAQCRKSASVTLAALQRATEQPTVLDPPRLHVDRLLRRCPL